MNINLKALLITILVFVAMISFICLTSFIPHTKLVKDIITFILLDFIFILVFSCIKASL